MKGISPLVASVLLLAIVVSIAVVVGSWVSGMAKDTTATVGNRTAESVSCSASDIVVTSLYITAGASGSARAQVQNRGFQAITLTSAQLINRTGHNFSTSTTLPILTRGQVAQLSFSSTSVPTCPTDFSRVVLTSNCGGISHSFTGTPDCV
ncbi:MAG: hypothetical protein QMD85_01315 [Candidatus Aenigmarchaeota archaeon]|nr:hypothetical protein [Candidatus Aenigmarchaeota archaeon]MDI6722191.1 hypothetical protein [Candidatus Aenigmarchaeota archaeon]